MKNIIIGYTIADDNIVVEFSNNKMVVKNTKENENEILNKIKQQQTKCNHLINKYRYIMNFILVLILLLMTISIVSMINFEFKSSIISIGIFIFIIIIDSYISSKYDNLIKALEFSEKISKYSVL